MTETKTLDVRGLSCPEPAMQTREALLALGSGTLIVLSDSFTSRTNIERAGNKIGWKAEVTQADDETYRITFTK
ncbi:MAG: sulfurtransferase TusA family protein [Anaerolineales bacterium]|nr:sulfurtransferase TusA family protein [Anaerolineales bacterium]